MNSLEHYLRGGTMANGRSLPIATTLLLTVGLVVGLGAIGRNASAVEVTAAAQVLADTTDGMLNEIDSQTVTDPVGQVSADKQSGIGVLGGVAHAKAGLGWIRLNAFSDSIVPMAFADGYLDAIAVGEFVDEITVTPANPALLNQSGTATFAYHVEGFVSKGAGRSGVLAAVNSPNPGLGTTFANNFNGEAFGANIDATREFTQNVVFGQPFELRVSMFATARVGVDDVATFAEVDLGNTFEWMGALEVVDQLEIEVTEYTMASASGTDYRNAIVAPADSDLNAGDFDTDGDVDGNDFLLWQRNPSVGSLADWETNYGLSASLSAAVATVPEPVTGRMLMLGMAAMLAGSRAAV